MNQLTADCIRHELDLAMWLLIIGFNRIAASPSTSEAVIMRTTRQLLENLYIYVDKQSERSTE